MGATNLLPLSGADGRNGIVIDGIEGGPEEDPTRAHPRTVQDVKHWGLDAQVNPEMYFPFEQNPQSSMSFVLEATADPLSLVPILQRHVRELDANLPLFQVRTMADVAARSVERRKWTMMLLACFAVLALVLGGSLAVMRGLRTILFGIEPTDPITLVSVGVSLMLVAILAVTVPALRAMRVDPVTALRAQ